MNEQPEHVDHFFETNFRTFQDISSTFQGHEHPKFQDNSRTYGKTSKNFKDILKDIQKTLFTLSYPTLQKNIEIIATVACLFNKI